MHNIYCMADLHGCYKIYKAMMDWCLIQDNECIIVMCGDACDRGKDGYKIMCELLNNPQVVYLKGNHEDLFTRAARGLIGYCAQSDELYNKFKSKNSNAAEAIIESCLNSDVILHVANGGLSTLIQWITEGADEDIIDKIEQLPLTFSYENIDFCHAGATYNEFKRVYDAEYNNTITSTKDIFSLMWDRNNLPLGWETGRVCVFGHTPVVSLPAGIYGRDKSIIRAHPCTWQDKMGAKDKRGGWKIDMDTATAWSDRAYILNCLTMTLTGFQYEKNTNEVKIIDHNTIKLS